MLQKIENYKSALLQLEKAVEAYRAAPEDALYRDGLIQRFEFTFELAWKSLKEYMEDQGVLVSILTPRAILKEAYAAGLIGDAALWSAALDCRNLTSHIYDEKTAREIAGRICGEFLPPLSALADFYREQ